MSAARSIIKLLVSLIGLVLEDKFRKKKMETMKSLLDKYSSAPVMKIELKSQPSVNMDGASVGSEEPCEICSVKHLLSSKTFLIEGRTRKGAEKQRKVMEAYRELQAAEQHLVEKHPDLAAEVRALRKEIEACAFTGELCDEIDINRIDSMIRRIIPHIPREHYFKPIEKVEA